MYINTILASHLIVKFLLKTSGEKKRIFPLSFRVSGMLRFIWQIANMNQLALGTQYMGI